MTRRSFTFSQTINNTPAQHCTGAVLYRLSFISAAVGVRLEKDPPPFDPIGDDETMPREPSPPRDGGTILLSLSPPATVAPFAHGLWAGSGSRPPIHTSVPPQLCLVAISSLCLAILSRASIEALVSTILASFPFPPVDNLALFDLG